jgi:DNA-binding SARP family transcriptional activator
MAVAQTSSMATAAARAACSSERVAVAAIDVLQQAVAIDPVHEDAQGLLMRLLVETGRRHLALRHYQALRAAVQREVDVESPASLQALYHDIRGGRPA